MAQLNDTVITGSLAVSNCIYGNVTCATNATTAINATNSTNATTATNACKGWNGSTFASFGSNAFNSTAFTTCTGTVTSINIYCGTTCKCGITSSGSICLGTNAFNSTSFTTCTGTVTSIKFQCASKDKCTICSSGTINLSANAWNTYATISTSTYPGACCTGTVTSSSGCAYDSARLGGTTASNYVQKLSVTCGGVTVTKIAPNLVTLCAVNGTVSDGFKALCSYFKTLPSLSSLGWFGSLYDSGGGSHGGSGYASWQSSNTCIEFRNQDGGWVAGLTTSRTATLNGSIMILARL
jgi:hypothetical protein